MQRNKCIENAHDLFIWAMKQIQELSAVLPWNDQIIQTGMSMHSGNTNLTDDTTNQLDIITRGHRPKLHRTWNTKQPKVDHPIFHAKLKRHSNLNPHHITTLTNRNTVMEQQLNNFTFHFTFYFNFSIFLCNFMRVATSHTTHFCNQRINSQ